MTPNLQVVLCHRVFRNLGAFRSHELTIAKSSDRSTQLTAELSSRQSTFSRQRTGLTGVESSRQRPGSRTLTTTASVLVWLCRLQAKEQRGEASSAGQGQEAVKISRIYAMIAKRSNAV
jgi:hypothetical protein